MKIKCESCGEALLEPVENEQVEGRFYICAEAKSMGNGSGCERLVSAEEYEERLEDERLEHQIQQRNGVESSSYEGQSEETEDEEFFVPSKQENVAAVLSDDVAVKRVPLLPQYLNVSDPAVVLRKPFKSPVPGAPNRSSELRRRLARSRYFVAWGETGRPVSPLPTLQIKSKPSIPEEDELPDGIEPLVLWQSEQTSEAERVEVRVDNKLTKFLRAHQREGVQFMFECVCGLRDFDGQGCILADDMGLGKTLQGIALLWTLLCQGVEGKPTVKRAIIVCPTSLVGNWDSECTKWLDGRVRTLPLSESSREDVISSIETFLSPKNMYDVLIVSYETFRIHAQRFSKGGSCDLLIADEAHRLKNDATLTNKALDSLPCRRRVLLSGTPMQNHLEEFFAMVNFTNPGLLGTPSEFRKHYESPIVIGREPDASDAERELANSRSEELSTIVNKFILRRTNTLLAAHLPTKVTEIVCCRLTTLQVNLYRHFLESKTADAALTGKQSKVLAAITALKKLCNHPKLIFDALTRVGVSDPSAAGFENAHDFFPPEMFGENRNGRGRMAVGWELLSGKFAVLSRLLAHLRKHTDDRIVIVSNYTETLELISSLCREKSYPFVRLDGSTSQKKRQKLVQAFNDLSQKQFVFLLSSKAGGCGLNLIGGNRLILFDPDWNPANDKQAAARVWRDGQKKRVFVYRFVSTGTIEEKIYQRQINKEGLQQVVNNDTDKQASNALSSDDLRDLFTLNLETSSDTHDNLDCQRCLSLHNSSCGELQDHEKQVGEPKEESLAEWAHHHTPASIADSVFQQVAGEEVSFVFSCIIENKGGMSTGEFEHRKILKQIKNSSKENNCPLKHLSKKSFEQMGNENQLPAQTLSTPNKRPKPTIVVEID
mmetsp:Transcript_11199/g.69143  ORF Transcript_11199/g.69143 Transcript_11199/m.69143 type:complete len:886 (+) Transcript_11199:228-2885(+)